MVPAGPGAVLLPALPWLRASGRPGPGRPPASFRSFVHRGRSGRSLRLGRKCTGVTEGISLEDDSETSRLASLRQKHRWSFNALLAAIRGSTGALQGGQTHTCVLIDHPRHAANVGSVLRQASILQGPGSGDAVSAVLLGTSSGALGPTERFLKSAIRISLAAKHPLDHGSRLVVLPPGDLAWALDALRAEGYQLCALENMESCSQAPSAPPVYPVWDAPLGQHARLLFLAGGEDKSLAPEIICMCDFQCYVPAVECSLAAGAAARRELGQTGQNPTLNLAHAVVLAIYERRRQLHFR